MTTTNVKSSIIHVIINVLPIFAFTLCLSLWQLTDDQRHEFSTLIFYNMWWTAPFIAYYLFKYFRNLLPVHLNVTIMLKCSCLLIFLLYPCAIFMRTEQLISAPFLISTAGGLFELLFLLSRFSQGENRFLQITKSLSMDTLVVALLAAVSCYLALLITSDLALWSKSNSVPSSVNFSNVYQHWPTFIGLTAQLFTLFMCGYLFYWLNRHVLIKRILKPFGFIPYSAAAISLAVLLTPILMSLYLLLPINAMGEPIIPAVEANPFDWANTRVFLAVLVISLPIITIVEWHQKSNALVRLKQHNTQTELQLLKQQINPHFLFNTLNNLYALSRKKSDQTPEVILQLSELMHYVVYQAQEPLVPISQEVDYINDYIGLQSIRLADHRNIHVTSRLDDEQATVAPLLLIILIENAFKHGMELSNHDAQLTIDITLSNNQLAFRCVNSLSHSSENAPITYGLGLSNLIRRLELIYPQRYQLELSEVSQTFIAQLTINLDSTASSEGNNA